MPSLITVADVRGRLQLVDDPTVNGVIEKSIVAAQLYIEEFLDTRFARGTATDVFYLDGSLHSGLQPNGLFRLYLSNGFVSGTPTIGYSDLWKGPFTTVPAEDLQFDNPRELQRGLVQIHKAYAGYYVKVEYTYGFAEDVVLSTVPEKLKEGILSYVPYVMNMSMPSIDEKGRNAYEASRKKQASHALSVLGPFMRNVGLAIKPAY